MSLDLCFWKSPSPGSDVEAYRLYRRLADGDWAAVEAAPQVVAFRQAVLLRHPDWQDAVIEPLSHDPGNDRYVALTLPFSTSGETIQEVLALAQRHRLVVFDPQTYEGPDDDWDEQALPVSGEAITAVFEGDPLVDILRKFGRRVGPLDL